MTLYQLWDPTVQFQTRSGKNLVNGTVEVTYLDRTQLAPVYDFDGKAIQNPVTLDENGRAAVYVEVDKQYTMHVYDQNMQLVYTQNICEYPKDVTVTVPTIESTESIDATLDGDTYTLDVKEDYIKKFGSNIFVIQYGDTSKTLTDLGQYDTVIMQMNSKTFYLTELTDSNAHFMSCYQVAGSDCIETCDYDGSAWTEVSTVNFDSNVLVITEGDTDVTYDQVSKYDAVLLKSTDGMLKGAMTYLHTGYAEFTVFTLKAGTRLAAEQTTVKVTFKSHTWSTSTSVIDKAISVIPYSDSTVTYSSVLFLIKTGGTCALRLANGDFAYLVDYDTVSIKFTWCRRIQGATEYYTLDSSNTWAMTTVSDVTAGTGIDISTDSVISSTGLVASQAGQTPDYLGNVLKAGQNITVTKDGAQVRIDASGSGVAGYYSILYEKASPSKCNMYTLSTSALQFDYLLIDWVDVDGNARRDQVNISELNKISSNSSKKAMSANNFTVFVPDSSVGFGWFKWFRWYLPDTTGITLYHSGGEYAMSSSGSISNQSTWSGTSTSVNSPQVYKIIGVIQHLDVKSNDLTSNVYIDITDSGVI